MTLKPHFDFSPSQKIKCYIVWTLVSSSKYSEVLLNFNEKCFLIIKIDDAYSGILDNSWTPKDRASSLQSKFLNSRQIIT